MKRIFSIFGLLIFLILGCKPNVQDSIPEIFKPYLKNISSKVPYQSVYPSFENNKQQIPDSISSQHAFQDIEMLQYLFETSYSGYEYFQAKGYDFDRYFEKLRNKVKSNGNLSAVYFEQEVAKLISNLNDGHISIVGKSYNHAHGHKNIYFCDILVEEQNMNTFVVIDSKNDYVKTGAIFTESEPEKYLFKTLSAPHKKQYLIGYLSYEIVNSKELSFNNKKQLVPFRSNRLLFYQDKYSEAFHIDNNGEFPVVNITSLRSSLHPKMKEFTKSAVQLKNEKMFILNALNNGGGSSAFAQDFIKNLNGSGNIEMYWAELISPPITEYFAHFDSELYSKVAPHYQKVIKDYGRQFESYHKTPHKNWLFSTNGKVQAEGTFDGKLIVLANRRTISGGEALVGSSASVKDRIFIGENTGGVAQFSSTCGYFLPNSKLVINLPRQMIMIPGLEETIGYLPDYWLDCSTPIEEILKWYKNPQHYQFSYKDSYKEFLESYLESIVLPKDAKQIQPAKNIKQEYAQYSGRWFGVLDGILGHYLLVERINSNNDVQAIYAWSKAPQWNIQQPGWQRMQGKFIDDSLVLTSSDNSFKITYHLNASGNMESKYERPGITAYEHLFKLE